jgi:hypothetical protein
LLASQQDHLKEEERPPHRSLPSFTSSILLLLSSTVLHVFPRTHAVSTVFLTEGNPGRKEGKSGSKGGAGVLPVPKIVLEAPIGPCARPSPEPGRAAHPPFGPIGPARGASGRRSEAGPWT